MCALSNVKSSETAKEKVIIDQTEAVSCSCPAAASPDSSEVSDLTVISENSADELRDDKPALCEPQIKGPDITGQKWGMLTAIRYDHTENGKHVWLFECECGNQKLIPSSYVKYGKVKSCGCLRSQKASDSNRKDITGKRFGKLTALEPTDKRNPNNGSIIWKCRCDCGNEIEVTATELHSKQVQSCGCLYKSTRKNSTENRKDLVDNTAVSNLVRSKKTRSDSTSGITGVSFDKKALKWIAYITFQGRRIYLGSYYRKEDAIDARKEAERKIHDPYIREMSELLSEKAMKQFMDYDGTPSKLSA